MFALAIKLIKSRQFSSMLFILIIAFSIMSMILIDCSLSFIQNTLFDKYKTTYGKHHGVFYDINSEQIGNINKENISTSGKIYLLGDNKTKGGNLTIGFFDKDAMSMQELTLLKGKFPQNENEIAVEKSQLKKIENTATIGSKIKITINDEIEKNYIVSGIINDYSNQWAVTDYQKRGVNTLPEAIVNQNSIKDFNVKHIHFVFDYKFERKIFEPSDIYSLGEDAGIDINSIVPNYKTYEDEYSTISIIKTIRIVLLVSLLLSIYLLSDMLIRMYITKFSNTYISIYQYGASKKAIIKLKNYQCVVLITISLVVALAAALISFVLIDLIAPIHMTYKFDLYHLLYILITIFIIFKRFNQPNNRILQNKFSNQTILKKKYRFFLDISLMGLNKDLASRVKSALAVTILVAGVFFISLYIHDINYGNDDELPDFNIRGSSEEVSLPAGDFDIVQNNNQCLSFEEVGDLIELEGVDTIYKESFMMGSVLTIDSDSAGRYWDLWNKDNTDEYAINQYYIEKTKDKKIINEVEFCVLTDEEVHTLSNKYPEYKFSKLAEDNSTIIFAPSKSIYGRELPDAKINENSTISIDRIEHKKGTNIEYPKIGNMKYTSSKLKSVSIINEAMNINLNGIPMQSDLPVVIMAEKNAEKAQITNGYSSVDVYLDENIDANRYETIESYLLDLGTSHPNFYFFSLENMKKNEQEMTAYISFALLFFSIIMLIYIFLEFFFIGTVNVRKNIRKIGILRANGFSPKRVAKSIVINSFGYQLVIFVVSLITIILELVILDAVFIKTYMNIFILIYIVIGLTSIAAILVASKPLFKSNIAECIRYIE